jgi:ABC-2 type transport system permease protein
MRGLWKLTRTEMKLFLREPMATFFTLGFPLMCLLLFGSMYGNKPIREFGGLGFVDTMVPGYTAMIIGTTGLMSLATGVAMSREKGVLRRLRATPLRPHAILTAHVFVLFLMTAVGMAILVIVAKLLYGFRLPGSLINVMLAFVLSCLSIFGIGFVLAGVTPTARSAQITSMVLFFLMMFLSGSVMPQPLPKTIRPYAQVLPLTHVVSLLRGLWTGGAWGNYIKEVCVLTGFLVACVIVSAKTFRWE